MRPLIRRTRRASLRDPAPSKWDYRLQRLMLTPGFVTLVRVGVPMALVAVIAVNWFSDEARVDALNQRISDAKEAVQMRPEFMVASLDVKGAGPVLEADVRRVLPLEFPVSFFDLDLEEIRETVAALNAVDDASVRVGESGALTVEVTPRIPVALWRAADNLQLLDADGVFTGVVASRNDRLDLPLIAGDGAQGHIQEALTLFRNAGPLAPRVRGLVRMGERRWDIVLDRGQRIKLPADGPIPALDRVIALHQTNNLLDRDVVAIDLRNGTRATVQLTSEATSALRRVNEEGIEE